MQRRVIACLVWACLSSFLTARGGDLANRLEPLITAHKGKVAVYIKNLDTGELFSHQADHPMPTASLIKLPVMVEALRQAKEGKIDLDTPIVHYLPGDYVKDPRGAAITPRNALSHTTGFPNWREFDNHDTLAIFFTPGKYFSYSGEGIELLQFVVETITGKKLEDLAQENIFKPFGMRRSSFVWQAAFEPARFCSAIPAV